MRLSAVLRWTARVWGIASFLFILAFVVGGAESMRPTAGEAFGLLLFPLGVVVGFAIAWWREGVGGLVSVGSLALFYLWMLGRDGRLPAGPYFLLLAAPGFLHTANALFCRSRTTHTQEKVPSATTAG
jgi:hypothetical protein